MFSVRYKKRALAAAVAVGSQALSSFAGETVASPKNFIVPAPAPPPRVSLYRDHEFQFDIFGAYAPSGSDAGRYLGDHAWGGGGAFNYFLTRNFGLGLEGTALRAAGSGSNHEVSGQFALDLLARYPIGDTPWAPYFITGIGGFVPGSSNNIFETTSESGDSTFHGHNNDDILLEGHVGLGIEYRFSRNIGAFTDGRYTFVDKSQNNYGQIRAGVRFAF